jgi:hypothetical protein
MIAVRKNSTEYRSVEKLIRQYAKKKDRKKFIKLYTLRPGETLKEKIALNASGADMDALYNINYESILAYFENPGHTLYRESEAPFYYFKSSSKSTWYEFPFEFTGKLKKQLFPLKRV